MATKRSRPGPARGGTGTVARPLGEREIAELQALLDAVPAPLEPLDICALDGFLCGVLIQPEPVDPARWLPFVTDVDARPLPPSFDARRIHALVRRRTEELRRAIERRAWFDPWVFEGDADLGGDDPIDLDDGGGDDPGDEAEDSAEGAGVEAILPWVAGCTAALETFPALLGTDDAGLTAPLALLYRHVGTDTLDDAEALRAEIGTLAPPADLAGAVEELVRAMLLLADVAGIRSAR
ncbi:MAG TPA: YecA family protein [Caldimonas sp.]|jgi:uncharacterized protein